MPLTLRSALAVSAENEPVLDAYARFFGRVSRDYFRRKHVRGEKTSALKKEFLLRHRLTGRQFNGIRFEVDAQVVAAESASKRHRARMKDRQARLRKRLKNLEAQNPTPARRIHETKRQLQRLEHRLSSHEETRTVPPLCFGSRRLFGAQFHLKENGYTDHAAWKQEWEWARGSRIHLVGSHDESAGNQNCQISVDQRGTGTAHLRLPDALADEVGTRFLTLPVRFSHGADALRWALEGHFVRDEKGRRRRVGNSPVTVRIFRGRKTHRKTGRPYGPWKWYLHATVEPRAVPLVSDRYRGALGVDTNQDKLALAHIDASGNPVRTWQIPVRMTDRRGAQVKAAIQEAAKDIVAYAEAHRIPVVMEALDFERKKQEMKAEGVPYRRMLSGFAYSAVGEALRARGAKCGIQVKQVNPAFTSVIGESKFASGYGLSVHEAAAVVIARRGMEFKQGECLRARHGRRRSRGTFSAPVRTRGKHVWTDWKKVLRARRAARLQEAKALRTAQRLRQLQRVRSASAHSGGGAALGDVCSRVPSVPA